MFVRINLLSAISIPGLNPSVWTVFGGEFRMPSGEKKGVADERAEEVFAGVQA
jgi:hypothetical protein